MNLNLKGGNLGVIGKVIVWCMNVYGISVCIVNNIMLNFF